MTDEELIARLRAVCTCNIDSTPCMAEDDCRDALAAADRIEQLVATNEALTNERDAAEQRGYANAMEAERKLHEDRVEALEAKLAKAVDTLEDIVKDCEAVYPPSHGAIKYFARATLEEIKGESHE